MTISLIDVCKYYNGSSHQDVALKYLQESISVDILNRFASLYRTAPKPSNTPKDLILNRIKELGLSLDSPSTGSGYGFTTTIVALEGCNPDFSLNDDRPDFFNDLVLAVCIYSSGDVKVYQPVVCTTEPGRYYTQNKLNPEGAARMKIDFKHKQIWQKGTHKNQRDCLVQIGGPVTVARDRNQDFARTGDNEYSGFFGINFHTTSSNVSKTSSIGRWSAGCLVIPDPSEFSSFMNKFVYNPQCLNKKFSLILLDASKIF